MKKFLFCFSICLLSGIFAFSQNKVIILNTTGNVEYLKSRDAGPQKIYPGLQLEAAGAIRFADGAAVKVLCKGKAHELIQAGTYDLDVLMKESSATKSLNFAARFWNFVTEGVSNTDNNEQLERYHRRYMENATGAIRGYAKSKYGIAVVPTTSGVIAEPTVQFQWYRRAPEEVYHFEIYRQSDEAVVYKAITRDTLMLLDFHQLVFNPEDQYRWMVRAENPQKDSTVIPLHDNPAMQSPKLGFTYQPKLKSEAMAKLYRNEDYRVAGPVEQSLMKAVALERKEMYYSADRQYRKLLRKNSDNLLVKKMYAAFLARVGELDRAMEELE